MSRRVNRFAKTGRDFIRACHGIKANFNSTEVQFASLTDVMETLPHLKKNENAVFETKLPMMAGMGDQCYPFARNKDEITFNYDVFRSSYLWFDMEVLRDFGLSPIEENVSFDFTEDAVWEMFLLSEITRHLPLFWHAGYLDVRYILSKTDLNIIQREHHGVISITNVAGFHSLRESRKMEVCKNIDEFLPLVVLVSPEEAIITLTEWSEWGGLSRRIIRVKKTRQGLKFLKPKVKVLVKYNCGICF